MKRSRRWVLIVLLVLWPLLATGCASMVRLSGVEPWHRESRPVTTAAFWVGNLVTAGVGYAVDILTGSAPWHAAVRRWGH